MKPEYDLFDDAHVAYHRAKRSEKVRVPIIPATNPAPKSTSNHTNWKTKTTIAPAQKKSEPAKRKYIKKSNPIELLPQKKLSSRSTKKS